MQKISLYFTWKLIFKSNGAEEIYTKLTEGNRKIRNRLQGSQGSQVKGDSQHKTSWLDSPQTWELVWGPLSPLKPCSPQTPSTPFPSPLGIADLTSWTLTLPVIGVKFCLAWWICTRHHETWWRKTDESLAFCCHVSSVLILPIHQPLLIPVSQLFQFSLLWPLTSYFTQSIDHIVWNHNISCIITPSSL